MLDGTIFRKPRQDKLSPPDVGLPGEVGEVLVNLPEPDLGGLGANHALVAPLHRHGNWKISLIHAERID